MLYVTRIEFRPNDLASPRTARLTNDIHPYLDEPAAFARGHISTRVYRKGSHVYGNREVV
jgi:hypothetical protein